jgi:hypothetical protein
MRRNRYRALQHVRCAARGCFALNRSSRSRFASRILSGRRCARALLEVSSAGDRWPAAKLPPDDGDTGGAGQ